MKKWAIMHLRTDKGIVAVPKRKVIKSLFCKHGNRITGVHCSEHGFERISGEDSYTVCLDCGKLLSEYHTEYW